VQDDQGFIWFGAQYWLARYDGYEFKVFKHEPGHPIRAKLSTWSSAGAGTEIELSIPGSHAYGRSRKRSRWQLFREKVG
jgi:hypothetical protein